MTAAKLDIVIEQGATFTKSLVWRQTTGGTPIDLTGKEGRMQIREVVEDTVKVLDLTSAEITLGGALGTIDISVSAVVTNAITIEEGVYDLEIFATADPTDVIRLIEGKVRVVPNVTR